MIDYRDGEWHSWEGGNSPVMSGDLVEFFTQGRFEQGLGSLTNYGSSFDFEWLGDSDDIVSFRVVQKAEEV